MSETEQTMRELARRVKLALEAGDLERYGELLDPAVRWGPPGADSPPCRTSDDVLRWYERGRQAGARATVSEVEVHGDRILVGIAVRRTRESRRRGGAALRWQSLTVRHGRIVDIAGFDWRAEALAYDPGLAPGDTG